MAGTALVCVVSVLSLPSPWFSDPTIYTQDFTCKGKEGQEGPRDQSSLKYSDRHFLIPFYLVIVTSWRIEWWRMGENCVLGLTLPWTFWVPLENSPKPSWPQFLSVANEGVGPYDSFPECGPQTRRFLAAYKYILLNGYVGLLKISIRRNCN